MGMLSKVDCRRKLCEFLMWSWLFMWIWSWLFMWVWRWLFMWIWSCYGAHPTSGHRRKTVKATSTTTRTTIDGLSLRACCRVLCGANANAWNVDTLAFECLRGACQVQRQAWSSSTFSFSTSGACTRFGDGGDGSEAQILELLGIHHRLHDLLHGHRRLDLLFACARWCSCRGGHEKLQCWVSTSPSSCPVWGCSISSKNKYRSLPIPTGIEKCEILIDARMVRKQADTRPTLIGNTYFVEMVPVTRLKWHDKLIDHTAWFVASAGILMARACGFTDLCGRWSDAQEPAVDRTKSSDDYKSMCTLWLRDQRNSPSRAINLPALLDNTGHEELHVLLQASRNDTIR